VDEAALVCAVIVGWRLVAWVCWSRWRRRLGNLADDVGYGRELGLAWAAVFVAAAALWLLR
jgi:hypothetical protein